MRTYIYIIHIYLYIYVYVYMAAMRQFYDEDQRL
jgi:hypothetical protein